MFDVEGEKQGSVIIFMKKMYTQRVISSFKILLGWYREYIKEDVWDGCAAVDEYVTSVESVWLPGGFWGCFHKLQWNVFLRGWWGAEEDLNTAFPTLPVIHHQSVFSGTETTNDWKITRGGPVMQHFTFCTLVFTVALFRVFRWCHLFFRRYYCCLSRFFLILFFLLYSFKSVLIHHHLLPSIKFAHLVPCSRPAQHDRLLVL